MWTMHRLSLSLSLTDKCDSCYLARVRRFVRCIIPQLQHCCIAHGELILVFFKLHGPMYGFYALHYSRTCRTRVRKQEKSKFDLALYALEFITRFAGKMYVHAFRIRRRAVASIRDKHAPRVYTVSAFL